MRRKTLWPAVLLLVGLLPRHQPAQQSTQSLGDLARRERERRKALTQAQGATEEPKLVAEEKAAYERVVSIVVAEAACKEHLGYYLPWEQLLAGCPQGTASSLQGADPRHDESYEYRLDIRGDQMEAGTCDRAL